MDSDFPVDGLVMKDQSTYQRDGSLKRERVYAFYLGKHGPFTERVALEPFDELEFGRRVDALRRHLQALPK